MIEGLRVGLARPLVGRCQPDAAAVGHLEDQREGDGLVDGAQKRRLILRKTAFERLIRVVVLVGQSGVGKSSLINKLLPSANATTGELSEQMAKGRHTTTAATLYPLSAGGFLIDSPGIREFGLWHMDADTVAHGFIEFRPYLGHCRFRDCNHLNQAGCAIMAEVDAKTISAETLVKLS